MHDGLFTATFAFADKSNADKDDQGEEAGYCYYDLALFLRDYVILFDYDSFKLWYSHGVISN